MAVIDGRGIMMAPPYFSPLRLGAASIAALSVIITGGWVAVAIGAALAIAIPFVSPPYWFALSQIAVIGLLGETTGLLLLLVEGGLLASFVLTTVSETDLQTGGILVVLTGLSIAGGWGIYWIWESVVSVVLVMGGMLALTLYLTYRYELVRLGLVGEGT